MRRRVHEQINTAYRTDIVQRDGSFCNENCRSLVDIEWNQLEIGELTSDSAKASGCRSTPTVGPRVRCGRWLRKLVEPGKVYCIVYRTELCYADRGAVVFMSHANSDRRAPTGTLSQVFRFYLALSGMMPAYSCNHMLDSSVAPNIIY